MPTFITLNLALSYLVQTGSPYIRFFTSSVCLYIGLAGIVISLLCALSRKISYNLWYDALACSLVLTWFAYWHEFFLDDAPMFHLFPLFFAFITALVSIVFISKRHYFDQESMDTIHFYSEMDRFHPALIITALIVSIGLPGHYLLFPVLMNVYIVRYTLTACLHR